MSKLTRIYNIPDGDAEVFYGKLYAVHLTAIGGAIMVDGANEEDAVDSAIDYAESMGWVGYFLDVNSIMELEQEGYLDEHYCGGNHGLYLSEASMPYVKRIPRIVRR